MAKVFFSYSTEDRNFAKALAHSLKELGHEAWIAEENIQWGDSFIDRTQEALQSAAAVIILLSEHSCNSKWIAFELGAATAQGKKVFPVVLSEDPDIVPFQLQKFFYLRASNLDPIEVASRIDKALQSGTNPSV